MSSVRQVSTLSLEPPEAPPEVAEAAEVVGEPGRWCRRGGFLLGFYWFLLLFYLFYWFLLVFYCFLEKNGEKQTSWSDLLAMMLEFL